MNEPCTTIGCPYPGTVPGVFEVDEPQRATYCRECADLMSDVFTPDVPAVEPPGETDDLRAYRALYRPDSEPPGETDRLREQIAERLADLTYRGRNMTRPEARSYADYVLSLVRAYAAEQLREAAEQLLWTTAATDTEVVSVRDLHAVADQLDGGTS